MLHANVKIGPAACQVMMQRGWMAEQEAKEHFRQLTGREDGEREMPPH